jgi:hypothetical protein
MEKVTGGCKCGAVRYRGERADAPMFRCHCRDCQQLTGGGHANMMPLVRETFALEGDVTTYAMQGGSGKLTYSLFCGACGSQLIRRSERSNDRLYVHAGSLDAPATFTPQMSIYTDAAQHWDAGIITDT